MPVIKDTEKVVGVTLSSGIHPAAHIIWPPLAGEFHTYGLKHIFNYVYVTAEIHSDCFRTCGHKLCKTFSTRQATGTIGDFFKFTSFYLLQ